jgi:hypothetical protein
VAENLAQRLRGRSNVENRAGSAGGMANSKATEIDLGREEWIEERSAILEYEAGFPRHLAERMAVAQWRDYAAKREKRDA